MSGLQIILACIAASALLLAYLFRSGGSKNALFVVAAFFALFAYGPVINYLAGNEYYFGTVERLIPKACIGFTLALLGLALVNRFVPQRERFDLERLAKETRHRYEFLPLAFFAVTVYAASVTLIRAPALLAADKQTALDLAGPGHRVYLFLAVCFTAYYFVARRTNLMRHLYVLHCITFVAYSLAFRERDFLLVFLSVLVHREILREKARSVRLVLAGAAGVILATFLFALRAGSGFGFVGVLNQGLLLFVDTYLMEHIPSVFRDHAWGQTYLDSLERLPPSFIYSTGEPTLSQWFVQLYNPGGTTGYGFSMTGEAYMNFGLIGIPIVFGLVAIFHRYLINRIDRSDWFAWASIYFTATWMYALRGDSLQLLKTMLFGAIVFAAFRIASSRCRPSVRSEEVSSSKR